MQMEMLNSLKAEPLADKKPYQEPAEVAGWRKRKVRNIQTRKMNQINEESSECGSELPGDNENDENDQDEDGQKQSKKKRKKRNKNVQEKLLRSGNKIPLTTDRNVRTAQYQQFFKYMIYDGYRPQTLAHARDYVDFLIRDNLSEDALDTLPPEHRPQHILDYLEQENQTKLPRDVNENEVLDFDQNFECGNLDSVYLVDVYEYNLLMKVDTNTKGNTYWFMFKVSDFMVGIRYRFNILNFSRNCEKFYSQGMNIVTKSERKSSKGADDAESKDGKQAASDAEDEQNEAEESADGTWRYDTCEGVQFFPQCDVVRSMRRNPETGEVQSIRYFSKLTFCYRFRPEDRDKVVTFAYAVPYGYTDLVKDLDAVKKNLMEM